MRQLTATDMKTMRRRAAEAVAMLNLLAHEARLGVLCELTGGEKSAGDLVRSSGLSQSALSQHLAKLRDDGLVATRRNGQSIYYRLDDPKAARLIAVLHELYCGRN